MKKKLAISLISISFIFFLLTIFWACWETGHPSYYPGEERLLVIWSLAGVLILFECILFLIGKYLTKVPYDDQIKNSNKQNNRKLVPFIIYLGGSIAIGLFYVIGAVAKLPHIKVLGVIFFPPIFLGQFIFSVFGVKIQPGLLQNIVNAVFCSLFYLGFFYPLYYLSSTSREYKPKFYKLMKIFLVIFCAVFVLLTVFYMALIKA